MDDYGLEEFGRQIGDNNKPGIVDKIIAVATGPVLGMLPPPVQRGMASEESAALMSKTSRYFNALWGAYGLASAGCKIFGVDIDPTPGSFATYGGLVAGIDSVVREAFNGVAYYMCPHQAKYLKVWGEPVISIAYDSLFNREKSVEANPSD